MKRSLLAASAMLLISTAAASANDMLFRVPNDVSAGHMNVRNGPGVNHGLIGEIPAGQIVRASQCVGRDDGIRGADWCYVPDFGRTGGWISQAGLMPAAQIPQDTRIEARLPGISEQDTWSPPGWETEPPARQPAASDRGSLFCGTPTVIIGDDAHDDNPVTSVEVNYNATDHAWRIFHYRRNGLVVARNEQYAIQDASNDRKSQWQGSLNRNRSLYMVGEARRNDQGQVVYMEWLYDRSLHNRLVMQMTTNCRPAPSGFSQRVPQPTN